MARCCAEADAPVGLPTEMRAVEALAVEVDEPAAVRALAYTVPEVRVDHALKVAAGRCVWWKTSRRSLGCYRSRLCRWQATGFLLDTGPALELRFKKRFAILPR
jgi:hypothetical protein